MGNANQRSGYGKDKLNESICFESSLLFHPTHSPNIRLSIDRRLAKRFDGIKGICFGDRPVRVGELITIRIMETSTSRNGALRFGFTCEDPRTIDPAELSRYASPDLTCEQGYWAKAVPEKLVQQGNVLGFWLSPDGDVLYGCNGSQYGAFFRGTQLEVPTWAMLDVFGSTIAVAVVDVELSVLNNLERPALIPACQKTVTTCQSRTSSVPTASRSQSVNSRISNRVSARDTPLSSLASTQAVTHGSPFEELRAVRETRSAGSTPVILPNSRVLKVPRNERQDGATVWCQREANGTAQPCSLMPFHYAIGRNICLSSDRMTATRLSEDYCNGYVFTSRPICVGEKLTIEILGVDPDYVGGLAFGVTACDPAEIRVTDLPDDSDRLLDRAEYWVVHKDVCIKPEVGDQLSFYLTRRGEVRFDRNSCPVATLMHVDVSLELWAFIDVYGTTQRIRSCGVTSKTSRLKNNRKVSNIDLGNQFAKSLGRLNLTSPADRCQTLSSANKDGACGFNEATLPARNLMTRPALMTTSVDRGTSFGRQRFLPSAPPVISDPFFDVPVSLPPPLIPVPTVGVSLKSNLVNSKTSLGGVSSNIPATVLSGFPIISSSSTPETVTQATSVVTLDPNRIYMSNPVNLTPNVLGKEESIATITRHSKRLSDGKGFSATSVAEPTNFSGDAGNSRVDLRDASSNDCVVCWEKVPDCALYTCGHMCLCYGCATSISKQPGALCPICRQPIQDVIKIFRS